LSSVDKLTASYPSATVNRPNDQRQLARRLPIDRERPAAPRPRTCKLAVHADSQLSERLRNARLVFPTIVGGRCIGTRFNMLIGVGPHFVLGI
jgi:hypothetical protein